MMKSHSIEYKVNHYNALVNKYLESVEIEEVTEVREVMIQAIQCGISLHFWFWIHDLELRISK